jgi:hypothetical protein
MTAVGGQLDTGPHTISTRRRPVGDGPSADPSERSCHCGELLVLCDGCRTLRCLNCDPYRSDDCVFEL